MEGRGMVVLFGSLVTATYLARHCTLVVVDFKSDERWRESVGNPREFDVASVRPSVP